MKHLELLREVEHQLSLLLAASRLPLSGRAIQHGDTTVLLHCLAVAYFSLKVSRGLRMRMDQNSLVRGALLHDYFLYDWHEPDSHRSLHGFHHAAAALRNAEEDFELTDLERDIISHHMFPLNLAPPKSREAILVCLVDKGCGLYETLGRNTYPALRALLERQESNT